MIGCSSFPNAFERNPSVWFGGLGELLEKALTRRSPGSVPPGVHPKLGLPAICGAIFRPGTTRARSNVEAVQIAIVDVDNAEEVPDPSGAVHERSGRPVMVKRPISNPAHLEEVCDQLEARGIAAAGWTTWSHSDDWPRFRVMIPLASAIPRDLWVQATEWILDRAGLNPWRECIDLPVLRDVSRLHFLPAQRPGGPPLQRRIVQGEILAPPPLHELERVLVAPQPLHPWQKEALASRARRYGGCSQGWAWSFRDSGGRPLDLKTLDGVRLLESLGCRVGPPRPYRGGSKCRTTCPWASEHSHGLDDDSAVLFLEPGRWPTWHCAHSHHAHLGLVDLLEMAGVLRV